MNHDMTSDCILRFSTLLTPFVMAFVAFLLINGAQTYSFDSQFLTPIWHYACFVVAGLHVFLGITQFREASAATDGLVRNAKTVTAWLVMLAAVMMGALGWQIMKIVEAAAQ